MLRAEFGGWFVDGAPTSFLGLLYDNPVPGDYDGDGDWEPAVYRDAAWLTEGGLTEFLGAYGKIPVPADCNGDGDADIAVYRSEVGGWYVQGQATMFYGLVSDIPLPLAAAVYESVFGCGFGTAPPTPPGGLPATC